MHLEVFMLMAITIFPFGGLILLIVGILTSLGIMTVPSAYLGSALLFGFSMWILSWSHFVKSSPEIVPNSYTSSTSRKLWKVGASILTLGLVLLTYPVFAFGFNLPQLQTIHWVTNMTWGIYWIGMFFCTLLWVMEIKSPTVMHSTS